MLVSGHGGTTSFDVCTASSLNHLCVFDTRLSTTVLSILEYTLLGILYFRSFDIYGTSESLINI